MLYMLLYRNVLHPLIQIHLKRKREEDCERREGESSTTNAREDGQSSMEMYFFCPGKSEAHDRVSLGWSL